MAKATQASRPEYESSHTTPLDASHYDIGFHVTIDRPQKQMSDLLAAGQCSPARREKLRGGVVGGEAAACIFLRCTSF